MHLLEAKDRENFEEGIANIFWAYKDSSILPTDLEIILDYGYCKDLNSAPPNDIKFWTLVAALK